MPRQPRLFIPGQPQHIVVRGHSRAPVFMQEDDFRYFYRCLREAAHKNLLSIHAWVLMHNHIHLLVTPANENALAKTMQSVGRRYAHYFNRRYHRTGSLWEGRYKSSLVDTDYYLLSCYRYIELNPVRAGMVIQPEDYAYSSYHANALGKVDSMVTPHELFLDYISVDASVKLSESEKADSDTRRVYRQLCSEVLDRKILSDIRRGTEKGLGIGRADFLLKVAGLR